MIYWIYQNEKPFLMDFPLNEVHRDDCSILSHEIIKMQFNLLGPPFNSDSEAMEFALENFLLKPSFCTHCMNIEEKN